MAQDYSQVKGNDGLTDDERRLKKAQPVDRFDGVTDEELAAEVKRRRARKAKTAE